MSDEGTPTAAPEPAAAVETPIENSLGLGHVMLIAIACSALSGFVAWKLAVSNAVTQPRLVAVDFSRLASVQMDQASKTAKSQEEAARMATDFATALNVVTKDYADRGYWVLDADRVLAVPFGNDITDEVAERLRKSGR